MKIHPVRAELSHADGWTDRRTYMTMPIFAFRNFVNAPKNCFKNGKRQSMYTFVTMTEKGLLAVIDVY
jgi:hypothetical protein